MKKVIVSLTLLLTFCFGFTIKDGVDAYEKGDYKTAKKIFESFPLDSNSTLYLHRMYEHGKGVIKDPVKANYWLGLYAATFGLEKDKIDREHHFKNLNFTKEQINMFYKYIDYLGKGGEKNTDDKYYESIIMYMAYVRSHPRALLELGKNYEHGLYGETQDYYRAIYFYEQAKVVYSLESKIKELTSKILEQEKIKMFKQKYTQAQIQNLVNLGNKYYDGKEIEQDYKEAFDYFEIAAYNGNTEAQYKLGYMYERGDGVEKDYSKSAHWYEKAAYNKNHDPKYSREAQFNLVLLYRYGKIKASEDLIVKNVVELLEKAGDSEHLPALDMLAGIYYDGLLGKVDFHKAVKLYEKAALKGHVNSEYYLGEMYLYGKGLEQNYQEALKWLEKASAKKHEKAIYELGIMYENGYGVMQDSIKAKSLFKLSCDSYYKLACSKL